MAHQQDVHFAGILASQLAMTRETWKALQNNGISEQSELRLDFFYNAPTSTAATELAALIREQTDYDVHIERSGPFYRRRWLVEGTTQKTAISQAVLEQWITWMVTAGKERHCNFDGWGAEVP
jgi:Regulator of ribonuclease activity B